MNESATPRLLVTLCTYNEKENLEQLIPELGRALVQVQELELEQEQEQVQELAWLC